MQQALPGKQWSGDVRIRVNVLPSEDQGQLALHLTHNLNRTPDLVRTEAGTNIVTWRIVDVWRQ